MCQKILVLLNTFMYVPISYREKKYFGRYCLQTFSRA